MSRPYRTKRARPTSGEGGGGGGGGNPDWHPRNEGEGDDDFVIRLFRSAIRAQYQSLYPGDTPVDHTRYFIVSPQPADTTALTLLQRKLNFQVLPRPALRMTHTIYAAYVATVIGGGGVGVDNGAPAARALEDALFAHAPCVAVTTVQYNADDEAYFFPLLRILGDYKGWAGLPTVSFSQTRAMRIGGAGSANLFLDEDLAEFGQYELVVNGPIPRIPSVGLILNSAFKDDDVYDDDAAAAGRRNVPDRIEEFVRRLVPTRADTSAPAIRLAKRDVMIKMFQRCAHYQANLVETILNLQVACDVVSAQSTQEDISNVFSSAPVQVPRTPAQAQAAERFAVALVPHAISRKLEDARVARARMIREDQIRRGGGV